MDIDHKNNNRLWYLLARKMANEITPPESEELVKLLQQHPYALNAQEMMEQRWHDSYKRLDETAADQAFERHRLRLQNALSEPASKQTADFNEEGSRGMYRRMFVRYGSIAAACMLVAFLAFKWNSAKQVSPQAAELQQLATQHGSRSQLTLPDRTKVWLNAGSKLDYPKQFTGKTREVKLEGEAYFDVTENKQQPFLVHTKAFTVKVLGTAFNIRAYGDEDSAATSLIRGSVEVALLSDESNKIVLRPNEKLTVPQISARHEAVTNATGEQRQAFSDKEINRSLVSLDRTNTVVETAWINNKLSFKNMGFQQIASSLEKWFAVEIKFKNDKAKKLKLSGSFEGESLEDILTAFSVADIEGGKQFSFKKDSSGVMWVY